MKTKNAAEIIKELRLEDLSLEDIASRLGKSFNSVWLWSKGNKECGIGDYRLLETILYEKRAAKK